MGREYASENGGTVDRETGLDPRQEAAIIALLNETTVLKAANACEVGERTLWTWLSQPKFQAEYLKRRRQAFGQSIAMLQRYSSMAVQVLAKIVADESSPCSCRVASAVAILRLARDGIEVDDLAARVAALENPLAGNSPLMIEHKPPVVPDNN